MNSKQHPKQRSQQRSQQRHATAAVGGKGVAVGGKGVNSAGIVLLSKVNVNPFNANEQPGLLRVLMVYDKTRSKWTIPAGKRDKGWSEWATAKKEFAEETGVRWGVLPDMLLSAELDVSIGESGKHYFRAYVFRTDERLRAIENSIGRKGKRLTYQGSGTSHYETSHLYWAAINPDGTFDNESSKRMNGRVFLPETLMIVAKAFPVLFQ